MGKQKQALLESHPKPGSSQASQWGFDHPTHVVANQKFLIVHALEKLMTAKQKLKEMPKDDSNLERNKFVTQMLSETWAVEKRYRDWVLLVEKPEVQAALKNTASLAEGLLAYCLYCSDNRDEEESCEEYVV